MSARRIACGLAAAIVTILGSVATAVATTSPTTNRLTVKGPMAVGYSASYQLTTSGYAYQPAGTKNPADEVVAWRTTSACQTGGSKPGTAYTAELKAQGTVAPAWESSVKGKFTHAQSYVGATKTGQTVYYWCAYLINQKTKHTFKVKGWQYSELGQGGPPGGPGGPGAP